METPNNSDTDIISKFILLKYDSDNANLDNDTIK